MIKKSNIRYENILNTKSGIIVHGCNAQGVMGKGLALEIRKKWPKVYVDYLEKYRKHGLVLGDIVYTEISKSPILVVASAVTQVFYKKHEQSKKNEVMVDYDAIRNVFKKLYEISKKYNLEINYPKIGGGLGGGDFEKIRIIINEELKEVKHTLWIADESKNISRINKTNKNIF